MQRSGGTGGRKNRSREDPSRGRARQRDHPFRHTKKSEIVALTAESNEQDETWA